MIADMLQFRLDVAPTIHHQLDFQGALTVQAATGRYRPGLSEVRRYVHRYIVRA